MRNRTRPSRLLRLTGLGIILPIAGVDPGMPRCSAHRDQGAGHHPPGLDAATRLTPSSFRQGCVDHVGINDRRRLGRFTVIQFEEDGARAPHIIGG